MLLERINDEQGFMGDLTQCADCLLLSHSGLLQEARDSFAQAAESEFGCLLVHGRVALATEKWWSRLTSQEVVVLSVLVHSLSGASSCDYPVFLPKEVLPSPFACSVSNYFLEFTCASSAAPNPPCTRQRMSSSVVFGPLLWRTCAAVWSRPNILLFPVC